MNTTYLLLGGNMGKLPQQLAKARRFIENKIGPIKKASALYQTAAWGHQQQPDFINQVIKVNTKLTADETLAACLAIEKVMGRKRTFKNAPRSIDIDILFYNKDIIHKAQLQIPHPQLINRMFTLVPLNEIAPMFKHPQGGKTLHQLMLNCTDPLLVKKIKP